MIIEGGVVPSNKMAKDGDYDEDHLQRCADTIAKAAEYQADPKLMKALRPYLEIKERAYHSLADLRKIGREKILEEYGKKMSGQESEMGYKSDDD